MADDERVRRYRAERAKGMRAASAWLAAKATASAVPKFGFLAKLDTDGQPVSGEVGGFTVSVRVVPDPDARLGDDDVTGEFTDTWSEGCVKNTRKFHGNGEGYAYYRPSNYTLKYTYDEFRESGMSKSVARAAFAKRIVEEMRTDSEREYFGVIVKVLAGGRMLADGSLWWIDSIPGYDVVPYLVDVAEELIETAIEEARAAIPEALEDIEAQASALRNLGKGTSE